MKPFQFSTLLFAVCAVLLTAGCKKGDVGPAGPAGKDGADGNANVRLFTYQNITFTSSYNFTLTGVSQGLADSSMVVAYYNPSTEASTSWYPIPGLGSSSLYEMRYFFYQTSASPSVYTFAVRAMQPNGTGSYNTQLTFNKVRIFLVPASSITVGGRGVADNNAALDIDDYYSVCRYFNVQP